MILIVDDVPGVVVAFGVALRRLSVPFVGAGSIGEARALLLQHPWTGFILDLELPDGKGVDLLEQLRAERRFERTPVVVITASILLDHSVVTRIERCDAALHCGAFTTPQVDAICQQLVQQR